MNDGHRHSYNRPPSSHPRNRVCIHCGISQVIIERVRKDKRREAAVGNNIREKFPEPKRTPAPRQKHLLPAEINAWVEWKRKTWGRAALKSNVNMGIIMEETDGSLTCYTMEGNGCYGSIGTLFRHPYYQGDFYDPQLGKYAKKKTIAKSIVAYLDNSHGNAFNRGRGGHSKIVQAYLNWLINRSPYRHAFLTKQVKDISPGACLMNLRMSAQYLVSAGTLLRAVQERRPFVGAWYHWRQVVNEDLAAILAQIYSVAWNSRGQLPNFTDMEKHPSIIFPATNSWNSGHATFSADLKLEGIQRYLRTDLELELTKESILKNATFYGRMTSWINRGTVSGVRRAMTKQGTDVWFNAGQKASNDPFFSIYGSNKLDMSMKEVADEFVKKNRLEEYVSA
ncbi:MAG TPA: hypothetical protein VKA31_11460 [Mariprofundaceae bacterium]|nr:hypothetical protein [Mariprofundaceae bacterium]